MVFSSLTFLFCFLPAVLLAHTLAPKEWRNWILLAASCFFYAWGEPRYLAVMLATIAVDYVGALAVDRLKGRFARRLALAFVVTANLGVLGYFKYFAFLADSFASLVRILFPCSLFPVPSSLSIVLPIGISFYTFQALSYVIDVARGEVAVQRNPFRLALYVTLFPQLIAGPIVKYRDVCAQIAVRTVRTENVVRGLQRFTLGLAKKVLVANAMGAFADRVFALPANALTCGAAWAGAVAYSFQLFYDFSGYSDMAIGLGEMFGFTFKENFDHPYVSRSITEFWRRWHISLSSWFKEYLYIPLGGNRVTLLRNVANLAVVFLATGLWHGAAWTFVAWGAWHGAFVVFERMTGWHKKTGGRLLAAVQHAYALLAVVFGWVLFRAETFAQAADFFRSMCGFGVATVPPPPETLQLLPPDVAALVAAVVCAAPVCSGMLAAARRSAVRGWLANAWLLLLFYLSVVQIVASTYNPFIYFRF